MDDKQYRTFHKDQYEADKKALNDAEGNDLVAADPKISTIRVESASNREAIEHILSRLVNGYFWGMELKHSTIPEATQALETLISKVEKEARIDELETLKSKTQYWTGRIPHEKFCIDAAEVDRRLKELKK